MIEKAILEHLYLTEKLSVAEIAQKLRSTFPRTLYWVKKHGIPIRSCSERTYVKFNPKGDPFCPKTQLTSKEKELFLTGLVIYWAEGSRKIRFNVQVVNMDYRMLQLFVRFLRDIVRVDESRLRLEVRVYHGFDRGGAHRYWSRFLKLRMSQVRVYPHIDHRSDPNKQWSPYGIATVSVSNTKLKIWLDQQLEKNIQRLLDQWSFSEAAPKGKLSSIVKEETATYAYGRPVDHSWITTCTG